MPRQPVVLLGRTTMRSRLWLGTVGAALVASGMGAVLLASSIDVTTVRLLRGDEPVNAGAKDPRDISANNSPSLVRNPVDPANFVLANRVDSPRFACGLHVSRNGGRSWDPVGLPSPEGAEANCFGPDATFGADGTLYISFVTLKGPENLPDAVWVVRSKDKGRTLSPPVRVLGPLAYYVRLTADAVRPGSLHVSWLQATAVGPFGFSKPTEGIFVTPSEDGGKTWGERVKVNTASRTRVLAPSPAIGSGGELFLAYLDLREDVLDYEGRHDGTGGEPYPGTWALVLARSRDMGATWEEVEVARRISPVARVLPFLAPYPSVAADPERRTVYMAFADARLGDADVWLWRSTNGGESFAAPRRVNDTRERDATSQYLPALGVSPSGRLDVIYYDRRSDRRDVLNEVSLQSSLDRGVSFIPRMRLSGRSFDSRIGFGSERGLPELGSRLGLVSEDARATVTWADTRAGTTASGKQDVATATVGFSDRQDSARVLRWGGWTVVAAALLFAASLLKRGGRLASEARSPDPVAF